MIARRIALTVGLLVNTLSGFAAGGGGANLVANPNFDADLTSWLGSSGTDTMWTSDQNHTNSLESGSALVSGVTRSQFIVQCVTAVDHDVRYFATVWAKSKCGHAAQIQLFWGDADCNVGVDQTTASTTVANAWQRLTVAATAPSARDVTAVLVLQNTGECHDAAYFDDVFFTQDTIMQNGFDGRSL